MFKQLLKKSKSNFLILSPCIHLGVDLGPKTGAFFFVCFFFFDLQLCSHTATWGYQCQKQTLYGKSQRQFIPHGYKLENCTFKKISKCIMYSSAWKMPWISHSSISCIQPSSFLQLVLCRQFSLQLKRLELTWLQGKLLPTLKTDLPARKTMKNSGISTPKFWMGQAEFGDAIPSNREH